MRMDVSLEVAMQLVFRKFSAGELPPPAAGEIYVRADPARSADGQGLATIVLQHGLAALPQGAGQAERIVVDVSSTHPTLDDMLAATFAQHLLDGKTLPEGCKAFADYAAVVRMGMRPANIALEDSLEGIFLAIRNAAGKDADLLDSAVGERFRKDWGRMAACIVQAAEKGVNPLKESPFAGRPEFMQERAFLLRDQEVYRQDVLRGELWRVRLPGGPEEASGLFLRQPTSLLFPYWSRTDSKAPVGSAYLLLAVHWGKGVWVMSTDPAQRLPIPTLAAALQTAETTRDPDSAARDPWYDGGRPEHGHTLVAAPRGGTKLAEAEVLRVVKKWAHARSPVPRRLALKIGATAAVLLLAGGMTWAYMHLPGPSPLPLDQLAPLTVSHVHINTVYTSKKSGRLKLAADSKTTSTTIIPSFESPYNVPHHANLRVKLTAEDSSFSKAPIISVTGLGSEAEKKAAAPPKLISETEVALDIRDIEFKGKDDQVTIAVTFDEAAMEPRQFKCELEWQPIGNLYVLAVGVSKYHNSGLNLKLPEKDVAELVRVFQTQEGGLFRKVVCRSLVNEGACRDDILVGLKWLRNKDYKIAAKEDCTPFDMVVVALSGHGDRTGAGHFVFAPPRLR